MTNETVVTAFVRDRTMAMRSVSAAVPFQASWSFTPVPGGTRVDWTWRVEVAGSRHLTERARQ